MRRRHVMVGVLAIATAMFVGFAEPAAAGVQFKLRAAKQPDGTFEQILTVNLADGDRRDLYLKAKNVSGPTASFTLDDTTAPANFYSVKYFRKDTNITAAITGAGYEFNLGPGKAKLFRMRVKRDGGPSSACFINRLQVGLEYEVTNVQLNSETGCD